MRILGLSEFERERRALDLNWNSQVAIVVKNPPADAGDAKDAGLIPRSGRSPGEGHGNPLQCSCLENAWRMLHQRSLVGNSPWSCKESDMT